MTIKQKYKKRLDYLYNNPALFYGIVAGDDTKDDEIEFEYIKLSDKIYDNVSRLINNVDDNLLNKWILFPDVDGGIYFDLKTRNFDAGINLYENSFSYFVDRGKLEGENSVPYTLESFIKILKEIS